MSSAFHCCDQRASSPSRAGLSGTATDAAGAAVTGETLGRALEAGLQPEDFLARNDAYHFFEGLDDLLKPGPTQTNVNDLSFLFAF